MKRIWFLAFAVSLGLNAGLLYVTFSQKGEAPGSERPHRFRDAPGDPGRGQRERPPGPLEDVGSIIEEHLGRMTRDLHLSEQQRSSIGKIHEELLPQVHAERRGMEKLRRTLASHYSRPTIDTSEFRALVDQLSTAQMRLDSLLAEVMLGEAALLTHEQRQRYVREMPWGHPVPPPNRPPQGPRGKPPDGPRDRPTEGPPPK